MMMNAPAIYAISPFIGLISIDPWDEIDPSKTKELP
jgi:hypothetical protein